MSLDASTTAKQIATSSYVVHLPQLDLTPIRIRITKEHLELTAEQLDELELRYRRFLMLCKTEPNVRHQPDKDVDIYWHTHILHTKQYTSDCQEYFGYFLHHYPNTALDGSCDGGCGDISLQSETVSGRETAAPLGQGLMAESGSSFRFSDNP